jgi:hypothetical protein
VDFIRRFTEAEGQLIRCVDGQLVLDAKTVRLQAAVFAQHYEQDLPLLFAAAGNGARRDLVGEGGPIKVSKSAVLVKNYKL